MGQFWPTDIELTEIQSPAEILRLAQQDWETSSDGSLVMCLQETEAKDGDSITIVYAKHTPSDRTARLFSVVHRPDYPYPVRIQPEDDLPEFYKKTFFRGGITRAMIGDFSEPRTVTNKWVCDTPKEFRSKLQEVLNLGSVTSKIISLASNIPPREAGEDESKREVASEDDVSE